MNLLINTEQYLWMFTLVICCIILVFNQFSLILAESQSNSIQGAGSIFECFVMAECWTIPLSCGWGLFVYLVIYDGLPHDVSHQISQPRS